MGGQLRVGVLASGGGTNLQALLDGVHGFEAKLVAVASDKVDAVALERARGAGVPTSAFPRDAFPDRPARDAAIGDWLDAQGVELVVLAGYMAILAVVRTARPSIGRTRVAEVLRGGQAKALIRNSWDGLPEYGTYAHLTAKVVVDRIDALVEDGLLEKTEGPRPVLRATAAAPPGPAPAGQSELVIEAA